MASRQDYSLRAVARLLELQVTDLDSKLWRSMVLLFTKPGELTRHFFDGRRTSFAKPLTLFVILNVVFFVIQPHTGLIQYSLAEYVEVERDTRRRVSAIAATDDSRRARLVRRSIARTGDMPGEFAVRFDAQLQGQKKSMLIVMIPVFALAMTGLRRMLGRGGHYLEHLVFSVHAYAFFLVVLVVVTPVFSGVAHVVAASAPLIGSDAVRAALRFLSTETALVLVLFAAIGSYLYRAIRRVHGDGRVRAAGQAVVLFAVLQALIVGYRAALFYLTLAAI